MSDSLFDYESAPLNGQIYTFYSFKGGVGRTMALANVAFLAAMNGKRVLVMDWDLEAPGLAYYFRGQLDAAEQRSLREAPGIMDIVQEWSQAVRSEKVDGAALLERFNSGRPYKEALRPVLASHSLPPGAALDYIGPGCRVSKNGSKRYEELLAEFSWSHFLNVEGGGIVLESLRRWSKQSYDLVFLDSRTGMADVAGICTMQLPDVVALCFIFNRQNIDGVAKVAGAIRAERSEQVRVRAAPMRVTRSATAEEADARARATTELTRVGGFSPDAVRDDFQSLEVALSENVPFYETLAPFVAPDPKLDLLTLNYARLGSSLIGNDLEVPAIDAKLVELVRRRLQPRHATTEYVMTKLRTMQPDRAVMELWGLIDNAFESALNGESLEDEYVAALVELAMSFPETSHLAIEAGELQSRTLDLLRELAQRDPLKWRPALVRSAQRYYDVYGYVIDPEEELLLLEELDGLLAESPTLAARLKRIFYRRRTAASYRRQQNNEAALQIVKETRQLIQAIPRDPPLAKDQANQLLFADVDTLLIEADILLDEERVSEALRIYETLSGKMAQREYDSDEDRTESKSLVFQLHAKLASQQLAPLFDSPAPRARHALQAALTGRTGAVTQFNQLVLPVIDAHDPELAAQFLMATLGAPEFRSKRIYSNIFGRNLRGAEQFVRSLTALVNDITKVDLQRRVSALDAVIDAVTGLLMNLRRRSTTTQGPPGESIVIAVQGLIDALLTAEVPAEIVAPLTDAYLAFRASRRAAT